MPVPAVTPHHNLQAETYPHTYPHTYPQQQRTRPAHLQNLGVSWQCRALKRCVGDACKDPACSPICKDANDCYCSQEPLTGSAGLTFVPKEHFFTDAAECQFEGDEYTASGVLVLVGERRWLASVGPGLSRH
jgi:hypothetical protein